jgi:hypothetical protein
MLLKSQSEDSALVRREENQMDLHDCVTGRVDIRQRVACRCSNAGVDERHVSLRRPRTRGVSGGDFDQGARRESHVGQVVVVAVIGPVVEEGGTAVLFHLRKERHKARRSVAWVRVVQLRKPLLDATGVSKNQDTNEIVAGGRDDAG